MKIKQMGSGGVNLEMWCEQKMHTSPAQITSSSTSEQKTRACKLHLNIPIPWFFEQTSNTKDVKYETTIPNI